MSNFGNSKFALTEEGISGELYDRLERAPDTELDDLATMMTSDQLKEEHVFTGINGGLKLWKGPRQMRELSEDTLVIENPLYEDSLVVPGDVLRYAGQKGGRAQVDQRISEIEEGTNGHRRELFIDKIINAEGSLAYNRNYFFATDHVFGQSGQMSNLVTFDISDDAGDVPSDQRGTAASPSSQIMGKAILRGIKTILGFKNNDGNKFRNSGARSFKVVCGLEYMEAVAGALGVVVHPSGATNLTPVAINAFGDKFDLNFAWLPEYTGTQIDVYRTDGSFKALIGQETDEFDVAVLGEDSEHWKKNYEAWFGVSLRRGTGYGEPRSACRVKLQN
ncbi:MAG TPA: hypothetical protein DFI00_06175 [Rhodospirillaceae bacterium]|nr:hypothetical protein [Alphaproteobacteria bacterium]OUT41960.1 MAG: hypothetical protein CBB62_06535 [Micavibrio sp. TMED2]HCI46861.1 hypothetical protein [Rhodospirillaceae bacterium]MAS46444.1 hypothetical protein [Alphaproteobacteria bacterium]MAX94539.1 hypothetical protein [Alphaproteobacteria bacterium]|tara:strand:- start:10660 stop:11661 length:1002 start_codon:yes stop_codon:yes gene_type:complete